MRRFGVLQKGKVRCCDNARTSEHNDCVHRHEKVAGESADFPARVAGGFADEYGEPVPMESGNDENTALAAGSLIGACFAGTITHPMDTIKTCMQGDLGGAKYGGVGATGRTLMAESGVGAFFRGWSWRTGRMICAVFIMGQCKKQLTPILFPDPEGGAGDEQ